MKCIDNNRTLCGLIIHFTDKSIIFKIESCKIPR